MPGLAFSSLRMGLLSLLCFAPGPVATAQAQEDPIATWVARLGGEDRELRSQARAELAEVPAPLKTAVLLAGLRAGADTARFCAHHLSPTELGEEDARLLVQALLPELARPEELPDEFDMIVGSTELPEVLGRLPRGRDEDHDSAYLVQQLHKVLRTEHIPLLIALVGEKDRRLAGKGLSHLTLVLQYADHAREPVARALLSRRYARTQLSETDPDGIGPLLEPAAPDRRPGLPPLLRQLCDRYFPAEPIDLEPPFWILRAQDWIERWCREVQAGPADRERMKRMLHCPYAVGQRAAIHCLGRSGEAEDLRTLLAFVRSGKGDDGLLAATYLARAGLAEGREYLTDAAARDALALALLYRLDRERYEPFLLEVCGPGDDARFEDLVGLGLDPRVARLGFAFGPEDFAWVRRAAMRGVLPAWKLARLVVEAPGCQDRALLGLAADPAAFAGLADPAPLLVSGFRDFLALCEVSEPRLLVRLLDGFAASEDGRLRDLALELRLRHGATEHAEALVAWLRGQPHERFLDLLPLLARSRSEHVQAFVEGLVRDGETLPLRARAAQALAAMHGIPDRVEWLARPEILAAEPLAAILTKVREGRGVEALLAWLEAADAVEPTVAHAEGVGLVADPRVTRYLEGVRDAAWRGQRLWAVQELAIQGRQDAIAELRALLNSGRRFAWEELSPLALLALGGPEHLGEVAGELASNCCRAATVSDLFDDILGRDFNELGDAGIRAHTARAFFAGPGQRLRWSRIRARWLPVIGIR